MKNTKTMTDFIQTFTGSLSKAQIKASYIISDISSKITIERCNRDMTQKEFAKYMGVTQGMVSKWESGDYNFTIESICNILEKLDLDCNFEIFKDNIMDNVQDISLELNKSDISNLSKIDLNDFKYLSLLEMAG
jgi:transcriptional regulator with XRE-family HTH domain